MNQQEMTLALRIRANAQQAMQELRNFNSFVGRMTSSNQLSRGLGMGFNAAGGAIRLALAPLRVAGGLLLAAGAGATVFGAAALNAAGETEALKLRLESVMGSARKAAQAFKETQAFAAATPFETDDLVGARIILEGIGVGGARALKSAAQAAAAMGRNVGDVASVVASMETEPLRRLGIGLQRDGDEATFQFADKMGKMQKFTVRGATEMRQALLRVFDVKFGGSTDKLSGSFRGLLSTLRDNIRIALGSIGNGLMPAAKSFIAFLNEKLGKLVESGALSQFGKSLGDKLQTAVDSAMAFFQTLPMAMDSVRQLFEKGPASFKNVMVATAAAMANIFMTAIVKSIGAMGGVFVGIGKMLAGAFMEDILMLPGFGNTRNQMALSKVSAMSIDERKALKSRLHIMGHESRVNDPVQFLQGATDAQKAVIAAMGGEKLFSQGVAQAAAAIPQAVSDIKDQAIIELEGIFSAIQIETGVDLSDEFKRRLAAIRRSHRASATPPSGSAGNAGGTTGAAAVIAASMNNGQYTTPYFAKAGSDNGDFAKRGDSSYFAKPGTGSGYFAAGGRSSMPSTVTPVGNGMAFDPRTHSYIHISSLTVRANDIRQLENGLVQFASKGGMAAAGN